MDNELILRDLAAEINTEHKLCETAMRETLAHALRCGQLLIEAKAQVKHGDWLEWVSNNTELKERTAQAYMRIASRWEQLENTQRVADLSMREALLLLAEATDKTPPSTGLEDRPPAIYTSGDFVSTLKWAVKRLKYIQSRPITNTVLAINQIMAVDVCMKRAAGGVLINVQEKFGANAHQWIFIQGHFFDFVGVAACIIGTMTIVKDQNGRVRGAINPLAALDHSAGREMLRMFGWIDMDDILRYTPDIDDLFRAMVDVYYMGMWRLCEKKGQPLENALSMSPAQILAIYPAVEDPGNEQF